MLIRLCSFDRVLLVWIVIFDGLFMLRRDIIVLFMGEMRLGVFVMMIRMDSCLLLLVVCGMSVRGLNGWRKLGIFSFLLSLKELLVLMIDILLMKLGVFS